ncbi:hypothetical protein K9840_25315 [Bacillus pacificus]|uniref:hypothetical protein n=1 Tax=Bacillus anthracis TaxID=1392 RepID=UPI0008730285|nr:MULTISPECIES: hypothetical protein [Bacillus cereus group]MCC0772236.1 hypothetical protein [Bacillus pacificus]OFE39681.1 hypothetical protein BGV83_24260 [Bacillus anthracis]
MKLSQVELVELIKNIYQEKQLDQKEQKEEIQKLCLGVAPLNPSFILNQKKIINEIQESFNRLYIDGNILETFIIVGNPGNGKSHILNLTSSYLSQVKNNIIINERAQGYGTQFDMQKLILKKANSQETLKAINNKVNNILEDYREAEEYLQINEIASKFDISMELARLIWLVSVGKDGLKKIKALNILTLRDTQDKIFKDLEIEEYDIERNSWDFFYILMGILKENGFYIILLIEELEHIFKWGVEEKQKFYEQLKEFIDHAEKLGNMRILMFSTHVFNDEYKNKVNFIQDEDPALHGRLHPLVRKIQQITNSEEVTELVNKLLVKYKVVYPDVNIELSNLVAEVQKLVGGITTYRNYIQKTMQLLEEERKIASKKDVEKEGNTAIPQGDKVIEKQAIVPQGDKVIGKCSREEIFNKIINERESMTTVALKKRILLSLAKLLECNEYKDIKVEIKKGYLFGTPKNKRNSRLFYLDYTPKNKVNDKYRALVDLQDLAEELGCDKNKLYFIYIKDRVTSSTEQRMMEYNPNINLISIDNDNINELLILTDQISENDRLEIATGLAGLFKLEVSD